MQNDVIPGKVLISSCPCCGTRLMSGRIIVGGVLQCSKCKSHWLVEMNADAYKVTIKRSQPTICKMNDRL